MATLFLPRFAIEFVSSLEGGNSEQHLMAPSFSLLYVECFVFQAHLGQPPFLSGHWGAVTMCGGA